MLADLGDDGSGSSPYKWWVRLIGYAVLVVVMVLMFAMVWTGTIPVW